MKMFRAILIAIIGTLLLAGCGSDDFAVYDPETGIITFADGSQLTRDELRGPQGETGPQGPQGVQGPAGQNGQDGADGDAGDPGLIVDTIDPCGPHDGPDEVLFILSNGQFAAWYKNVGLVILEDGTYITTDKQRCKFRISGDHFEEV